MTFPEGIQKRGRQWRNLWTQAKFGQLARIVVSLITLAGRGSFKLTRPLGLSNFNILKTKRFGNYLLISYRYLHTYPPRILEVARIIPAVNQVELHPFLPQHELFEFSTNHGILLMAHQPLGGRPVPVVRAHPDVPFPTEDSTVRRHQDDKLTPVTQPTVIRSSTLQRNAKCRPRR